MFFSRQNLSLYRVTSTEASRPALAGILVDPKRGVTAASDGKRLVEIAAPSVDPENYPSQGIELANGRTKPFVLPAKVARDLLKVLPKKGTPPVTYAALALSPKGNGSTGLAMKRTIITAEGQSLTFEPIDAEFPDYREKIFPTEKPLAGLVVDPCLLSDTIVATALEEEGLTLHLYADRIVLEAKKDALKSRAVLMALNNKQSREAPRPPEPDTVNPAAEPPEATPPNEETNTTSTAEVPEECPQIPSRRCSTRGAAGLAERAFFTFLVRSRGEKITPEDLEASSLRERIETLKGYPAKDDSFATLWQWKKLFGLLAEREVDSTTFCNVLNGLSSLRDTAEVIEKWRETVETTPAAPQAA